MQHYGFLFIDFGVLCSMTENMIFDEKRIIIYYILVLLFVIMQCIKRKR
jgi:hypothetical protein